MAIETDEYGTMTITGGDIELFAALSVKTRLHLELSNMAFSPQTGRILRGKGIVKSRNREGAYREFCALKGLDPKCGSDRYPEHDHGEQRTFRVKDVRGNWVVVRGEDR